MQKGAELVGKTFGMLTVIKKAPKNNDKFNRTFWKCRCECGNIKNIPTSQLTGGMTKSCGCYYKKNPQKRMESAIKVREAKDLKEKTDLSNISKNVSQINSKSGIRGVCWSNNAQKWISYLNLKGQRIFWKSFDNKQDAINARKKAEEIYFEPILEKYNYKETN